MDGKQETTSSPAYTTEREQGPASGYHQPQQPPITNQYPVPPYHNPTQPQVYFTHPNQGVIFPQPQMVITNQAINPGPPDYLIFSVFTMLCCFFPTGIPALIFSIIVRDNVSKGDMEHARHCSVTARNLNICGLILGLIWIIISIILSIVSIRKR